MRGEGTLAVEAVNAYLAWKQHLVTGSEGADVVSVTRDIVALHATMPTSPYLSLWARMGPRWEDRQSSRAALEYALYDSRELVRIPCMRNTLHVVAGDQVVRFLSAYSLRHLPPELTNWNDLLVRAGLCSEERAGGTLMRLMRQVLSIVKEEGPLTAREIIQRVPELAAQVKHSEGKTYEGAFSLGSRFVPFLCAVGILARTRPRGTWRSNLYEYVALADWLPGYDEGRPGLQTAQAWLVERYLHAYGPATPGDIQWWTGLAMGEVESALHLLGSLAVPVAIDGLNGGYRMLAEDAQRLQAYSPPTHSVFLLPVLDPYIMGYQDRRRFLAAEHMGKAFDRAGNALPTVWVDGRVAGAWTQRKDGTVVCGLFEEVNAEARAMIEEQRTCLEAFFDGEYVPPRTHSPFTKELEA